MNARTPEESVTKSVRGRLRDHYVRYCPAHVRASPKDKVGNGRTGAVMWKCMNRGRQKEIGGAREKWPQNVVGTVTLAARKRKKSEEDEGLGKKNKGQVLRG